jgi:hypothetical protein
VIDGDATSGFRGFAMSSLNQSYSELIWKIAVWVLLTLVSILGYYLPIPLTEYPPEDARIFVGAFTLMNIGIRPWVLALVLWQAAAMILNSANSGFPNISAFSARVLVTALIMAAVSSYNVARTLYYWHPDDSVSFTSIFPPIVSLLAAFSLLIFLGRMMDRIWQGWGFWALYAGIAISGAGLSVLEIIQAFSTGAITVSQIRVFTLLMAASVPISISTVWLHRSHLGNDSRPLLLAISILVFLKSILWDQLKLFMASEHATAIYFSDHSGFLNSMITAILTVLVGLLWLRFWPNVTLRTRLLPYGGLALLLVIDTLLLESPTLPPLGPAEFLIMATLAVEMFRFMNEAKQRKVMTESFAGKTR